MAEIKPPKAREEARKWREKQGRQLQMREPPLTNGAEGRNKTSKSENNISQMEQNAGRHPPKARRCSHDWRETKQTTLQKRDRGLMFGGKEERIKE